MFIWTAKLRRGRLVAGVAAIVVLCGAVALVGGVLSARGVDAVSPAPASPKGIKTNEDRIAYLESYGWQVDPEPRSEREVQIPKTFDETYQAYNAIQLEQGLDLVPYQGKRATLYTYELTEYPTGEEGVTANLLIRRNRLIAADISSAESDGCVHGITEFPENGDIQKEDTAGETADGA